MNRIAILEGFEGRRKKRSSKRKGTRRASKRRSTSSRAKRGLTTQQRKFKTAALFCWGQVDKGALKRKSIGTCMRKHLK